MITLAYSGTEARAAAVSDSATHLTVVTADGLVELCEDDNDNKTSTR